MDAAQLPPPPSAPIRRRRWLAPAGLVLSGLLFGGILAGSQVAGAEDSSSSSPSIEAATEARHGTDATGVCLAEEPAGSSEDGASTG